MPSHSSDINPPVADTTSTTKKIHGHTVLDNYAWLRQKEDPKVLSYLKLENEYTKAIMSHTEDLQNQLYEEMVGRIKETDMSVPIKKGEFFYYTRTEKGKNYAIYCRKHRSSDAKEEILIDGNVLAEGQKFFRIGVFKPSPDHNILAYSVDYNGYEDYQLYFKNLTTGDLLEDTIEATAPSAEWANDNTTVYYLIMDEIKRPCAIRRHSLGTPTTEDVTIYEDADKTFFVDFFKTKDNRYLIRESASIDSAEAAFIDLTTPYAPFQLFAKRKEKIEYSIDHHEGYFYVPQMHGPRSLHTVIGLN
ncbi:MAG: hypothetical protein ACXAB7_04850 [Candidatus Kariarchaeaceae archaeon]|jgi:oligopeptidase B